VVLKSNQLAVVLRMKKQKVAAVADKDIEQQRNSRKQVAFNRKARHEYEIMDTYDAGLVLVGTEVKSLRAGRVNITDGFCRIEHNEAWLYNMHISPFDQGSRFNVEPVRKRKLLLHSWQIEELRNKMEQKGFSVVPLSLYFQRGFAKIEIALGKGKKLWDKRESIAEKDQEREARRQFKAGE
jgi:SsrA-binding protein